MWAIVIRSPDGRLDDHRGGGIGDLGGGTAHDAGQSDRLVGGVHDHAVVDRDGSLDVVKGGDGLAVTTHPHAEMTVGDEAQIVGVVGLTQLEHHVVGDVDDRVDRSHAGSGQAGRHPRRRLPDGDVVEYPGAEPLAEVRGLDRDGRALGGGWIQLGEHRLPVGERNTELGGQVTGHSGHRQGVGPVAFDVDVEQHIGLDPERIGQRLTQGEPAGEDVDAVGVLGDPQLGGRAQHPVGPLTPHLSAGDLQAAGHDGTECGEGHEVPDRHVERSAADLQRLAVAGVDVDQLNPVGLGVSPQLEHLGHDDAVPARADDRHVLDDKADVGQRPRQVVRIALDRSEFPHPGE